MDSALTGIELAVAAISTGFLALTFLQYRLNRREFPPVVLEGTAEPDKAVATERRPGERDSGMDPGAAGPPPLMTICVPVRNEERNLPGLLQCLQALDDPNLEILLLDDRSEDRTPELLAPFAGQGSSRIRVLDGASRPEGWLGKPWACHQLGERAAGELIVFLDADTRPEPAFCTGIRKRFEQERADMLTVWPVQVLGSFWEEAVIPLVYHALITLLPFRYIRRRPRWMPARLYGLLRHRFAAANGQCVAFTRQAYRNIGGHAGVRGEVVEDVALARRVRAQGMRLRMLTGHGGLRCRMYADPSEMWEGFAKNFLAGFDGNVPLFLLMGLLHIGVFLAPPALLAISLAGGDWIASFALAVPVFLVVLQRRSLDRWMGWPNRAKWFHWIGVMWFQALAAKILYNAATGTRTMWKGRPV